MYERDDLKVSEWLRDAGLPWSHSPKHGVDDGSIEIRWIQVCELPKARVRIGLSDLAEWVRIESGSATVFNGYEPFFLPILEERFSEARETIHRSLKRLGFTGLVDEIFPFEEIVTLGLKSGSEHWVHHALEWVPELPVSDHLVGLLEVSSRSAPTQRLRHKAKRLAQRARRHWIDKLDGDEETGPGSGEP